MHFLFIVKIFRFLGLGWGRILFIFRCNSRFIRILGIGRRSICRLWFRWLSVGIVRRFRVEYRGLVRRWGIRGLLWSAGLFIGFCRLGFSLLGLLSRASSRSLYHCFPTSLSTSLSPFTFTSTSPSISLQFPRWYTSNTNSAN